MDEKRKEVLEKQNDNSINGKMKRVCIKLSPLEIRMIKELKENGLEINVSEITRKAIKEIYKKFNNLELSQTTDKKK